MLKIVWKIEIPTLPIPAVANAGLKLKNVNIAIPKIIVPITLNDRWMTAARFAFLGAPILDNNAVKQDPILEPRLI